MTVYLVGAGPGDPGLLTMRGAEVLASADVVVYDRLSVSSLLDLAPPAADRISVGKSPGRATTTQDEINALLVERGRAGQEVVRLKGGDPFVFARGGEEAAALLAAGVPFEVVPGVSSAIAVPAYAGIPVTLRHSSTSFLVVTGHEELEGFEPDSTLDWDAVARVGGTIVLLMGVAKVGEIAKRLLTGGRDPDTPVTSITWGTRPEQTTVRATLATIGEQVLQAPATIVIGDVAAENLTWFEQRPLLGRRVVVTRPEHQAGELVRLLRDSGAAALEVPTIAIADPADGGEQLRQALSRVTLYDWVVLTSANGARRMLAGLRDARDLGGVQVAAIGPGTASALAEGNIEADLVPEQFVAESLVDRFPDAPTEYAGRVLIARAEIARDVLPDGLRARGWEVDVVDAYRAVPVSLTDKQLGEISAADAITFTSSSTVEQFVAAGGRDHLPRAVVCIGPVTAATARDLALPVTVEADPHTMRGLVDALIAALA